MASNLGDSKMSGKLLLIGGGGHCRSVLDCVLSLNYYDDIGIVDFDSSISMLSIPVIGCDDDLPTLKSNGWTNAFVTVGSIGSTALRRKIYDKLIKMGFQCPSIIDSSANIANNVKVGEGVFIGKGAIINTGTKIGNCAIVNTGSIIEHDCSIGDVSHISTGSTLCGQVVIGNDTHVGAGAVVRQCVTIGDNTIIGAGSVVVKDISSNVKAYGNPCRVIE